jgi:hypothetical protein
VVYLLGVFGKFFLHMDKDRKRPRTWITCRSLVDIKGGAKLYLK